jgi:hypothetical protein
VHLLEKFEKKKKHTDLDDLIILQLGYQSLNTNTFFLKQFFKKKSILMKKPYN